MHKNIFEQAQDTSVCPQETFVCFKDRGRVTGHAMKHIINFKFSEKKKKEKREQFLSMHNLV